MISIKKYLTKADSETISAFERMAQLLLQAIGLHAVEGERNDYDRFRTTMTDVQTSFAEDPSPSNVLVSTGSAIKALQEYNRRTSHYIRAQGVELQGIVGMLTQAMLQITAGSQTSISRLQELQKMIEGAVMVEDMRTLKSSLSQCLESIKVETARQREESALAVAEIDQGLRRARAPKTSPHTGDTDSLTGLPLRAHGEKAIRAACGEQVQAYAGMFLIDRIQVISSRFGVPLGDKLVLFFLQHLSQGLSSEDQLFRWGRGAFLAVMERTESHEQVRRELARLLSRRLEQTFEMGDRSVVIPVASTWIVVPLLKSDPVEISRKLDAFIAASPGQAPA